MENHAGAPLNPGIVFEMVQAHQRTAALKAAIDLDMFRAVGEGPGDVASIARHCAGVGAGHSHSVRFSGDQRSAGEGAMAAIKHTPIERGVS